MIAIPVKIKGDTSTAVPGCTRVPLKIARALRNAKRQFGASLRCSTALHLLCCTSLRCSYCAVRWYLLPPSQMQSAGQSAGEEPSPASEVDDETGLRDQIHELEQCVNLLVRKRSKRSKTVAAARSGAAASAASSAAPAPAISALDPSTRRVGQRRQEKNKARAGLVLDIELTPPSSGRDSDKGGAAGKSKGGAVVNDAAGSDKGGTASKGGKSAVQYSRRVDSRKLDSADMVASSRIRTHAGSFRGPRSGDGRDPLADSSIRRNSTLRHADERMASASRLASGIRHKVPPHPDGEGGDEEGGVGGAIAGVAKNFKEELAMRGVKISFLILPDSQLRRNLDRALVLSMLYTGIAVPYSIAFDPTGIADTQMAALGAVGPSAPRAPRDATAQPACQPAAQPQSAVSRNPAALRGAQP